MSLIPTTPSITANTSIACLFVESKTLYIAVYITSLDIDSLSETFWSVPLKEAVAASPFRPFSINSFYEMLS
jgi:hypothetical protein